MTDETETLTARARQLEAENALLRSMQSPSGDEAGVHAENLMLRGELDLVRGAQTPAASAVPADVPKTLAEFVALPAAQRQIVARRMTRQQRDELLGRRDAGQGRESYL